MYPPPLAWRNDRHDPRRDEAAADLGRQGTLRAILARSSSLLGVYLQPRVGRPGKATGVLFGTDLIGCRAPRPFANSGIDPGVYLILIRNH